ncbi:hypothetical protein RyT2_07390 [Pseudolactococcus yaeyamensis]
MTQTVIIKNGSEGAYVKSKNGVAFTVESYQVAHVVATVGAGDVFAAGLISGLLDQESICPTCLCYWGICGAIGWRQ